MHTLSTNSIVATPHVYKGFCIIEHDRWYYAVPEELGPVHWKHWRHLLQHPAVMAAPSRDNLELLIDDFDPATLRPESLGSFEGYQLTRYRGLCYAVPEALGPIDLNDPRQRNQRDILTAKTQSDLEQRIRAAGSEKRVEFAGWLPIYRKFGNCGQHPQFGHTDTPPSGFRFIRSVWVPPDPVAPVPQRRGWKDRLWARWHRARRMWAALKHSVRQHIRNLVRYGPRKAGSTILAAGRLFFRLRGKGAGLLPALRFIHTRHFESQLMLPADSGMVFLTSVPFTYGQHPWMIEVEDATTLFYPFIHNGRTAGIQPRQLPCWSMVRELLEEPNCRAIVTHIRSTARSIPVLFDSPLIAAKTFHLPMGVEMPDRPVDQDDDDFLHLLFTNSWHQEWAGFQVRGGYEVLEAFAILHKRYPHLRLTMRTNTPPLIDRHVRMLEEGWVRVISRFLPSAEMAELQRRSHICLLPAARIHIVSLLQAMAYGQAVVASDGWGFDEYVEAGRNGLVVPGRSKVTWMDQQAGFLREDYSSMHKPNPLVVDGIVKAVSQLVEDPALRRRIAANARADVAERYNIARWNEGLRSVFEQVYPQHG